MSHSVKVILLERIRKLGTLGDVVTVKAGFARNYLLPQKKALRATEGNVRFFEAERARIEQSSKDEAIKAQGFAKDIDGSTFIVIRQTSDVGMLYGSVTRKDIASLLQEKSVTVSAKSIILDAPIKSMGVYTIAIQLHPEVTASIILSIAPTQEEAEKNLSEENTTSVE